VNPRSLAALGLTLADVRVALAQANVNQAKGSFDGLRQSFLIGANDQLLTSEAYRALVVAHRGGAPILLSDVADVVDGAENERQAAWMGTTPAVIMNVKRQPGANIIEVVDRVRRLLPSLRATLPAGVEVTTLTDRTITVRASVEDVQWELGLTVVLVVLVIFLFLRNLPATIIPSVAVPLSLVGTFGVMYLLGYSLNNLTLMALTISTGFVVDDAIVMIENISRHLEAGDPPMTAAMKGSEEIGFTIVSLSISLIAVLIPLLFMGDIVGRLFREFAVTLSVTIVLSAVVSLTLTPMMCARILKHRPDRERSRLFHASERAFKGLTEFYATTLRFVLRHQGATLLVAVATLAATVWMFVIIPKGFFPVQDTGVLVGVSEAPQGTSFASMSERQRRLAEVILADEDVASLSSFIGVDGTNVTVNTGRIQIDLKPHDQRQATAVEVMRRLDRAVERVEDIRLYLQPVQDLTVEDRLSRTQYQLSLESSDPAELARWVPLVVERLRTLPELVSVASDQQNEGLRTRIVIDRDTASRLGITAQGLDDALYDAFGQRQVTTMFTQVNQYRVVLEVAPEFRGAPADLDHLRLRSSKGGDVPLRAVARVVEGSVPLSISKQAQFPVATISFDVAPGAALGDAVAAVVRARRALELPETVHLELQGTAKVFESSLGNQWVLILAALVTVYIVLGVLYESYIHPVTILSTLPSAGVGALLALQVCGEDFGVISLIGIILLLGIVKKNGIMMIDFALDAERREGKSPPDAIYEACLLRLRPILMTTFAALLAGVPLALGSGVGTELRRPLGITMIGGLLVSQVLTLYTTPVIYLAFDRLAARFRRRAPRAASGAEAPTLA